jgi:signal transduction histidine kinase
VALEKRGQIVDLKGISRGTNSDEMAVRNHELRAALYGIEAVALGLSDRHDRLTAEELRELTSAVASEARRLRSMLDPRAESLESFDLAEAIRPAVVSALWSGLDLISSVPAGIIVEGRPNAAVQVLIALLTNARDHATGSTVEIRVRVCEATTTLYVEDRGAGISAAQREHVFEQGARRPGSAGSGIGLFVARRLMEEQGGSLSVERRAGGGSSFAMTFRTSPSRAQRRLVSIPLQPALAA